jgi:hypothetical protein
MGFRKTNLIRFEPPSAEKYSFSTINPLGNGTKSSRPSLKRNN